MFLELATIASMGAPERSMTKGICYLPSLSQGCNSVFPSSPTSNMLESVQAPQELKHPDPESLFLTI